MFSACPREKLPWSGVLLCRLSLHKEQSLSLILKVDSENLSTCSRAVGPSKLIFNLVICDNSLIFKSNLTSVCHLLISYEIFFFRMLSGHCLHFLQIRFTICMVLHVFFIENLLLLICMLGHLATCFKA